MPHLCGMGNVMTINDLYTQVRSNNAGRVPGVVEVRSNTLLNPEMWAFNSGMMTAVPVNEERALTLAAIYACCRVLSEAMASLPVGLFSKNGSNIKLADDFREHYLVSKEPSPLYTSYNFISTMQFHLSLRGNAYARILRDGRGEVKELRIMHPNWVSTYIENGTLYYQVSIPTEHGGKGSEILRAYEVLHIAALSSDGITGRSPISVLRETIGIGLSNRDFVGDIHRNGGRVRGVLAHPSKLTGEQVESLRNGFVNAVNQGRFPVLENGVEFKTISLTPADAEFVNTNKITLHDIARTYRVPLHMIGDLERATFSNIEHQSIEFNGNTMRPWVKNWECELDRKLIPYRFKSTHFFRFNLDAALRSDIKSRYEAYSKAIQWGFMNRDEVRALENKNPIPEGLGEQYFSPLNMALLGEETKEETGDNDELEETKTLN